MSNFVSYIKESYKELTEKMTWISWEEAQKSTAAVAAFTVLFALAIFAADKLFQGFLKSLFELI
jgi:preprotein translocase subunit SecE